MKSSMRITFIFLSLLFLFMSIPSYSIAERRIALVIGNGSYDFGRLKNSVNDANDMAATLKKLGFSVILRNNASHKEMETAIKELGRQLKKDDVGIFFYAGHGVQIEGHNYLIPIGANIEEESDVKYRAVNLSRILDVMDSAGNRLNIIILDACRNNPYAGSFRSTTRGLAIVEKSPKDTLIAYSTSPNQVAIDGSGRNSPYTKALLDNMTIPNIPIEQVFKKVRNRLDKVTGGKQVPWYISSLGRDFYFMTGSAKLVTDGAESVTTKTSPADELESAMAKVQEKKDEEERRKSEKDDMYRVLAADIKKFRAIKEANIDEALKERAWIALMKKYPQWLEGIAAKQETGLIERVLKEDKSGSFGNFLREEGVGGFIAYNNGTILDTKTNLIWAAKDNGTDINWLNAKSYCENYRGGGYTDWRMPKQDELEGLYDNVRIYGVNLTDLILLTKWVWASETRGSEAAILYFSAGGRGWAHQSSFHNFYRALPVRSAK